MSWVAVGAAVSVAGSLFGGSSERRAQRRARREARRFEELARTAGANITTAGEQSRTNLRGAAEDIRSTLTSAAEEIREEGGAVRTARDSAANQLTRLLEGDFENTPGYEFIRSESLRGVERAASARGANVSGNVLTELQQRSRDLASTEYTTILRNLNSILGTSGNVSAGQRQSYTNLLTNANNIYSTLFQGGEASRLNAVQSGETAILRGSGEAIGSIAQTQLAQGQSSASTANNIASTLGTTLSTIFDRGSSSVPSRPDTPLPSQFLVDVN